MMPAMPPFTIFGTRENCPWVTLLLAEGVAADVECDIAAEVVQDAMWDEKNGSPDLEGDNAFKELQGKLAADLSLDAMDASTSTVAMYFSTLPSYDRFHAKGTTVCGKAVEALRGHSHGWK